MATARFIVEGRVQGVFFRASTRAQALALELSGSACNLPDGSVEVVVVGDEAAIAALAGWLRRGPPAARVDRVRRFACDVPVAAGFVTG